MLGVRALGIDEDACTGCGLCRPACPVEAIGFDWAAEPLPVERSTATAFVACAGSGVRSGPGVVACLDGLGAGDLASLEARGAGRIAVAELACESCEHQRSGAFDRALARQNARRAANGAPAIALEQVPVAAWLRKRAAAVEAENDVDQCRRGLLRLFLTTGSDLIDEGPRLPAAVVVRFTPRIAPEHCRGCDACVRVCRYGALRLDHGAESAAYQIEAARCTGCGVCVDVCDAGAIGIVEGDLKGCERVALREGSCRRCGASFRVPAAQGGDRTTCFICRQKGSVGRLFQVRE